MKNKNKCTHLKAQRAGCSTILTKGPSTVEDVASILSSKYRDGDLLFDDFKSTRTHTHTVKWHKGHSCRFRSKAGGEIKWRSDQWFWAGFVAARDAERRETGSQAAKQEQEGDKKLAGMKERRAWSSTHTHLQGNFLHLPI